LKFCKYTILIGGNVGNGKRESSALFFCFFTRDLMLNRIYFKISVQKSSQSRTII
jgi:hypothetical protein